MAVQAENECPVLTVLNTIGREETLLAKSERNETAKSQIKLIMDVIKSPLGATKIEAFDAALSRELESLVTKAVDTRNWELLWVSYHKLRLKKLKDLWKNFGHDLGLGELEPILEQTVLDSVLDLLIRKHTQDSKTSSGSGSSISQSRESTLSHIEKNIVRYAAGYVAKSIKQRYEKLDTDEAAEIVECLSQMAVEGPGINFYDYTQEWTKKVNRGGLFEVNESTFLLFCSIEFKVRQLLNDTLAKRERGRHREKLLSELTADEDILFYWSMNSGLLPNDGMGLLKEILSMWLTIRGHSIAGSWMETYKSLNKARVKKKRSAGLRESLKLKAAKKQK